MVTPWPSFFAPENRVLAITWRFSRRFRSHSNLLLSDVSFLIYLIIGVSFYEYALLNSGVEYRVGEFVVFDSSSNARRSHADLAASLAPNKLVGLSSTKVIRGFIQEGDLPTYVLLEDVFGRHELAARGIRCGTSNLVCHYGRNTTEMLLSVLLQTLLLLVISLNSFWKSFDQFANLASLLAAPHSSLSVFLIFLIILRHTML